MSAHTNSGSGPPRAPHGCRRERNDAGTRVANTKIAHGLPGAAAGVEDRAWRKLHVLEPLDHARADLALQRRGAIVGARGTRESAPHRLRIDVARIGRREIGLRHRGTKARRRGTYRDATGTARAPRL